MTICVNVQGKFRLNNFNMDSIIATLSEPWPWYIAGPAIGLMVPLMLFVLNKNFGVSSSLRHLCAMCSISTTDYFNYSWRNEAWNVVFVLGIMVGGYIAGTYLPYDIPVDISDATSDKLATLGIIDFSGMHPSQIFSLENISSPVTLISVILGGFLVGFGTRYAGGCTSGHAIMGLSLLNVGSLVAVIGFFFGGLTMSWFILPSILSVL